MVTNQKPTGRATSMPVGLLAGGCVSIGITLLGVLLLAKMLDSQRLLWSQVGYGVMAVLVLASMAGALVSFGKIKRQRMVVCLASGGVYFAMLMLIPALFFGGQYEAVGVTALLVLGASITIGLTGVGRGKRRKRNKTVRHHR